MGEYREVVLGLSREELHTEARELGPEIDADARNLFARADLDEEVLSHLRNAVRVVPPGTVYRIRDDAPHPMAGAVGAIASYFSGDLVRFEVHVLRVPASEPLPDGLDLTEDGTLQVCVDPCWLAPDPSPFSVDAS